VGSPLITPPQDWRRGNISIPARGPSLSLFYSFPISLKKQTHVCVVQRISSVFDIPITKKKQKKKNSDTSQKIKKKKKKWTITTPWNKKKKSARHIMTQYTISWLSVFIWLENVNMLHVLFYWRFTSKQKKCKYVRDGWMGKKQRANSQLFRPLCYVYSPMSLWSFVFLFL
jgi:hypothetical protein